jgi:hypothetical protein
MAGERDRPIERDGDGTRGNIRHAMIRDETPGRALEPPGAAGDRDVAMGDEDAPGDGARPLVAEVELVAIRQPSSTWTGTTINSDARSESSGLLRQSRDPRTGRLRRG